MISNSNRAAHGARPAVLAGLFAASAMLCGTALCQDVDDAPRPIPAADQGPIHAPEQEPIHTPEQPPAPEDGEKRAEFIPRFELQIEFETLLDADDPAAAVALADDLLALSAAEFGADSTMYADVLLQVAEAQTRNEQYALAQENSLRAIEIYRDQEGSFSATLVHPYVALGDSYQAGEDYVSALTAYEEARSISRRNFGLLNSGQIEILGRMSESAKELGQLTDAQEFQLQALMLVRRSNEPYSQEVLDATFRYGHWLRQEHMFTAERTLYMEAQRDVTEALGDESLENAALLRETANSFRSESMNHAQGRAALVRALEIAEDKGDALALAEAHRDIGDWETAFGRGGSDGTSYLKSWAMLGDVEDGERLREEWYGPSPNREVFLAARDGRPFSSDPDAEQGRVFIYFTVQTNGVPTDISVTDADPPGIAENALINQIRLSRFRPVIKDGRLVSARRGYIVDFFYDPKRYD